MCVRHEVWNNPRGGLYVVPHLRFGELLPEKKQAATVGHIPRLSSMGFALGQPLRYGWQEFPESRPRAWELSTRELEDQRTDGCVTRLHPVILIVDGVDATLVE